MTTFVRSMNVWRIDATKTPSMKTISAGDDLDAIAIGPAQVWVANSRDRVAGPLSPPSLSADSHPGASRRSPTAIGCLAFAV
jgi:hypothetical protein